MFEIVYIEKMNGKINHFIKKGLIKRDIDVVSILHELSEGLPSNPFCGLREIANKWKGDSANYTYSDATYHIIVKVVKNGN